MMLKEASLRRLDSLLKNQKDSRELGDSFICSSVKVDDVIPSGLGTLEKYHIKQWVKGTTSGRQCLLSLYDAKNIEGIYNTNISLLSHGSNSPSTALALLSKSVDLPETFLSDSGLLFDTIFSKTPSFVLKEALKLLSNKAVEKSSPLNTEQINLALHQIKVDHIKLENNKSNNDNINKKEEELDIVMNDENENTNKNNHNDDNNDNDKNIEIKLNNNEKKIDDDLKAKHASETFRTQILTELIRIHILGKSNSDNDDENIIESTGDSEPIPIMQSILESELDTPLQIAIEQAQNLSLTDLEKSNNTLKPYIRQLAALKASLTSQFKELEDSRAFIALGLNKNASDAAIKKAYHSKAVKLHPDKGGDKEKFQKLNDLYQEVLKAKRADNAVHEATMQSSLDPQTRESAEKARDILDDMENMLREVKLAADKCGRLGQRSIRLQSLFDNAASLKFPKAIKKIDKLLSKKSDCSDHSLDSDENFRKKSSLDVNCCEATLALPSLEKICESMQSLASSAMNLPSCGNRYGLSAAKNSSFMKLVESSMSAGIVALKNISSIIVMDEQVNSALDRFRELKDKAIELPEIHDLLLNLITTAFRSRSVQTVAIAEKAVAAAITAAELCGVSGEIIKLADEEIREEAKRAAAAKEEESHYSEEDRAELAEVRRKQREEMCKQHSEEFEKEQEDKKKEENDSIESLKDQIKSLQVQLRVQHVQALHSLNGEAREIQKKLQQELVNVAKATTIEKLDLSSPRQKSDGETDFKNSLLSLVAELIDCSCNSLRTDIQTSSSSSSSSSIEADDAKLLLQKHLGWMINLVGSQTVEDIEDKISVEGKTIDDDDVTHDYDDIDLNIKLDNDSNKNSDENSSTVMNEVEIKETISDLEINSNDSNDNKDNDNNNHNNEGNDHNHNQDIKKKKEKKFKSVRLALLPDFRSKVLWVSALLDETNINKIVNVELFARLKHIFDQVLCEQNMIDEFCSEIVEAINIASKDIAVAKEIL